MREIMKDKTEIQSEDVSLPRRDPVRENIEIVKEGDFETPALLASVATTSCRRCVFAEYKTDPQSGYAEQTGCAAGRFDAFEENGVDLIFVEEDKEKFYLVKDKACIYFRHVDAYAQILKANSIEEIKERVASSLKIPYHVLIFLRQWDTIADLEQRLVELEQQAVKPKIVSVIDRTHSEVDITPQVVGLFHNKYSFEHWRTQRVTAQDMLDITITDVCYDNTKSMKYFFYTIFEASTPIPASFSAEIHHYVQDKMKSFVMLEPNSKGNGKTVLKMAHEKYAGNSFEIELEKKLVHYDDGAHLIRKVEDVCPSLRTS
jgi:hypothetical protein